MSEILVNLENVVWEEHSQNPIIEPPFYSPIIGDPTFVTPDLSPDGSFHLFAFSFLGLEHFTSTDGLSYKKVSRKGLPFKALRPFIYKLDGGTFALYYEKVLSLVPHTRFMQSRIEVVLSKDLFTWSNPQVVFEPDKSWHEGVCGNPCLVKDESGFRLYFSAGRVFLPDCMFIEPKHIGVAFSKDPLSDFQGLESPIISPDTTNLHMNLGSGSAKVLRAGSKYVAFINGIFEAGHSPNGQKYSSSGIKIFDSQDGLSWKSPGNEFLLAPSTSSLKGDELTFAVTKRKNRGWKHAFIYACDVREYNGELWMYFNARDGWFIGKERIGLIKGALRTAS